MTIKSLLLIVITQLLMICVSCKSTSRFNDTNGRHHNHNVWKTKNERLVFGPSATGISLQKTETISGGHDPFRVNGFEADGGVSIGNNGFKVGGQVAVNGIQTGGVASQCPPCRGKFLGILFFSLKNISINFFFWICPTYRMNNL